MNKENVIIILVEPGSPGNIGSTLRAMKNMGFYCLRLINPVQWRDKHSYNIEVKRMAWGAADLLDRVDEFPDIPSAIKDIDVVIGTSAKHGRYRHAEILPDRASIIANQSKNNRIAILFGPEQRGLSTRELSYCQQLITIPSSDAYSTLNLAQSVLIICYHLHLCSDIQGESLESASQQEILELYQHMKQALYDIGFLKHQNPDHAMEIVKKILGRSGLTSGEVRTLRGIFRQVDWAAHRWNPPLWID